VTPEELIAEVERLRAALKAIQNTPRKDGILTCQRLASAALAGGPAPIEQGEASLGNPGYFREVIAYLHWRWDSKCAYCGDPTAEQIDHVRPSSRGGDDSIKNLVLCCVGCNKDKGASTAEEFGHPDLGIIACGQTLKDWRQSAERRRRESDAIRRIFAEREEEQPF
jgi:hypothetical protein